MQTQSTNTNLPSFTMTVKRDHHALLRRVLSEGNHGKVKLHTDNHPGHIIPTEGQGLEYDYEPVEGKDEVMVKVTKNPFDLTGEQIKMELEHAYEKIVAVG